MKICIKGDSIRIRLTKSEVDLFGADGRVEETTHFVGSQLVYVLSRSGAVDNLSAKFAGNTITMLVPEAMAHEWTTTETVGYQHNMDLGNGSALFLLLEKDFKCIDAPSWEDQSDNYEHPDITCK